MHAEGVRVEKIEELLVDAEGVHAEKIQELLMNVEGVVWKIFDPRCNWCTALPTGYKKKLLRCNWCKKSVLGNTFKGKHGGEKPGHEYLSYTEVGQTSLDLTKCMSKFSCEDQNTIKNLQFNEEIF